MKRSLKIFFMLISIVFILINISVSVYASNSSQVVMQSEYSNTTDAIRINWNKVDAAAGYRVYMLVDGSYTKIATISSGSTTTYRVSGLESNSEYSFKVNAYFKSGSVITWASASEEFSAMTEADNETITSYTRTQNAIRINWTQNVEAEGYRVYMLIDGTYTKVATLTSGTTTTYRISGLSVDTEYSFKVKAYYKVKGVTVWADVSEEFSVKTESDQVVIVSDTQTINAIRINWENIAGADGYRVYMLVDGEYEKIATVTSGNTTTYRISGLSSDTSYTFKVKAYYKTGSVTTWANASEEYKVSTNRDMEKFTDYTNTENAIRLNWTQNENAAGYRIYMLVDGSYEKIATVSGSDSTTYRVSQLSANTSYTFKVKAYYKVKGVTTWADVSDAFVVKTQSDQVIISSNTQTASTITLKWEKTSGADGYRVYIYKNGTYVSLKTIYGEAVTSYTATGLSANTAYSFQIKAFYKTSNDTTWAKASEAYSAKTNVSQVAISSAITSKYTVTLNWSKVSGATGYTIYMLKNGTYTAVGTVSSSTLKYTVSNLNAGTKYCFKIAAYRLDSKVTNYGQSSSIYSITTDPLYTFATYPDLWVTPASTVITPAAKTVYLTFDDGPSDRTIEILDILKEYNVKATFFICAQVPSQRTDEAIAILQRIVDEGHAIGVHSYTHDYSSIYSSVSAFLSDFNKLYEFIYENTGYQPTTFRFPGGSNTSYNSAIRTEIIDELEKRGFVYFDWNSSNQDATGVSYTSSQMAQFAISSFKSTSYTIVLMHDFSTKTQTPASAELIIQYGLANGYTFDILTNEIKPIQFA